MPDRPWHTLFEAALELHLPVRRIRELVEDGGLPTRRLGRMLIILDADLESFRAEARR